MNKKSPRVKESNLVEYDLLPKQAQSVAGKIVDIIKNNKNFKIHSNGEISIQNKKLKNSNINDLIGDLLRDRRNAEIPPHGEKFIRFLSEINLPQTFIKSKKRLKLYKNILNESSEKPTFKVPKIKSVTHFKVSRRKKRKVDFLNSDL